VSGRRALPSGPARSPSTLREAPREREEQGDGVLGDGHGIQSGHVGDPHPFAGGRVKVDVVDPHSELLDEAEAPRPDSPAG
jgi:hypothetical protein